MMDHASATQAVLDRGWLADQEAAVRAAVLAAARLMRMAPGGFLFHVADDPGGIYGLAAGGIGVHVPTPDGDLRLLHVLRPGAWFGYGPALRNRPRSLSFSVIEDSWLFHLALERVHEIARLSPAHQRAILVMTEYGMDSAIAVMGSMAIRDLDRRLLSTILRVLPADGDLRLTQAQLGEMVGADRQAVNRALKRMAARGWLEVRYGGIRVTGGAEVESFLRGG